MSEQVRVTPVKYVEPNLRKLARALLLLVEEQRQLNAVGKQRGHKK